jgi:hypothetical protein
MILQQQIITLHLEMRERFNAIDDSLQTLTRQLESIQRIIYTQTKLMLDVIRRNQVFLVNYMEKEFNALAYAVFFTAEELRNLSLLTLLSPFKETCSRITENDEISEFYRELTLSQFGEMREGLLYWITEGCKEATINGGLLIGNLNNNNDPGLSENNVINSIMPREYSNILGYLANYALKISKNIESKERFKNYMLIGNPALWLKGVDAYLTLRSTATQYISEKTAEDVRVLNARIIPVGKEIMELIANLQRVDLFEDLFAGLREIINSIFSFVTTYIDNANKINPLDIPGLRYSTIDFEHSSYGTNYNPKTQPPEPDLNIINQYFHANAADIKSFFTQSYVGVKDNHILHESDFAPDYHLNSIANAISTFLISHGMQDIYDAILANEIVPLHDINEQLQAWSEQVKMMDTYLERKGIPGRTRALTAEKIPVEFCFLERINEGRITYSYEFINLGDSKWIDQYCLFSDNLGNPPKK